MKTMQKAFDQELKNLFKPEKLGSDLIRKKLKDLGIEINESQLEGIKRQFRYPKNDEIHFEFEDDQVYQAGFTSKEQLEEALNLINSLSP